MGGKNDIGKVGGHSIAGKSLGRESFIDMLVSSGLPLVENERTGTLLTTSANFRILLLSVPRFLPAACTEIRNLN